MKDLTHLLDYLAAAIVDKMRSFTTAPIESIQNITDILKSSYGVNIDEKQAFLTAHRLEQLAFLKITHDDYAGVFLAARNSGATLIQIGHVERLRPDSTFVHALAGGPSLLKRVFQNREFWKDLSTLLNSDPQDPTDADNEIGQSVPASDRIVTLTHNQQLDLEQDSSAVIDAVSNANSIDGDVALRERMLAQLRAGRELIRAQVIRVYLLQETVLEVLNSLIQRYGEKAMGALAKKLLDRLVEYVFGK